jgi:hypothetical protein
MVSQFLLVLSRLRHEQGDIVDGAAYHQGSSVKGSAIIGQDAGGNWRATALTDLWEHLAGSLVFDGTTGGLNYAGSARILALTFGSASVSTDRLFTLAGTGATLSKYLGADVQDLPKETNLPALWAIPTTFGRSDDFDHDESGITIGVALKKEGKTATANYTKLDGYALLVGLSGLISARIETALAGNMLSLSDITMDVDYPYFKATWSFRVPESA